jgi:hypothetical protein
MTKEHLASEERKMIGRNPRSDGQRGDQASKPAGGQTALSALQQQAGNQAVQRLLAQRSAAGSGGSFELDDETAGRINQSRGGGQVLDSSLQVQMSESLGHDMSGVRVHTSAESDDLNRQLGAKAFTTGQDVFFREGAYDPHSSNGRELIAHELTHVVQQSTGAVGGGPGMTVNAPGDAFEQQADAVASTITGPAPAASIQREAIEEPEDDSIQMQEYDPDQEEEL